jgi:hypothetical protein
MDGACSTYGDERGIYRFWFLIGKPEGKRPFGRSRRRGEDHIKMDVQEAGCGVDCIDPAQDRESWRALVIAVVNLRVP